MAAFLKSHITKVSLLMFLSFLLSGCFGKFFMTEKEIDKFYETHSPRPKNYTIDTLGYKLFYTYQNEKADSLPLIIFIHGAPGAWYGFLNFLQDSFMLKNFRMISVDRPGYGLSKSKKRDLPDIEIQAAVISAAIPKKEKQPVIVAGRSYGAPVAAMMAYLNPKSVSGLLLISPAADPLNEKFWWFNKPIYHPPLRWIFPSAINTASDEKFSHIKQLQKILPNWQKIKQPSIILQGDKDFIIHKNNVCFLDSLMTSSPHEYHVLENTGHLITKEKPELIKQSIVKLSSASGITFSTTEIKISE